MTDLIQIKQIQINGADVNAVDTRELYNKLGLSKGQYSRWITKNLLNDDLFEPMIDYVGVRHNVEGNIIQSYIATLDTAKHLSMLARTKKGKEIRDYFIKCEKELRVQQNFQIPQTYAEALRLSADLAEKNTQLTQTIKNKDDVILAVADLNIKAGNVSFADFAKNLAIENMGRNNVIKFCKARGYLRDNTEPYQPFVNRGYFVRKPSKEKINGEVRYTTFLTPRGTVWLTKIIKAEFELDDEEVA